MRPGPGSTGTAAHSGVQEYDLRNTASIEESVRHSDVVYNLVGRDYPTKSVRTRATLRIKH